ncbi:IS3 family transposase [Clostridium oceanicum]|uniref:Integrase catalytic domain-containing protein n=1 Tax=Clostridium oceanicum TaxID=1543 RepID=A0ABN1JCI8_9CLOT
MIIVLSTSNNNKLVFDTLDQAIIDNGLIEGFWGTLKSEMYYLKKFNTYEEFKEGIDQYIEFYNTKRLQKKLKGMTPIEYRNHTLSI